ncbi:ATP-binding protein [Halobaculum sp. MBLA0147]|uniref:ATP-binding protein n=1 Tax=Halobaculum sp. MBLA0147 TaxID=3079934 RepID=UPI0035240EA4
MSGAVTREASVETLTVPTVVFAPGGDGVARVVGVNTAFERVFGFDEGAVVGEPVASVLCPRGHGTDGGTDTESVGGRSGRDEAGASEGGDGGDPEAGLTDPTRAGVVETAALDGRRVRTDVRRVTEDGVRDFRVQAGPVPVDAVTDDGATAETEANGVDTETRAGGDYVDWTACGCACYTDLSDHRARERALESLHRVTRELFAADSERAVARAATAAASDVVGLPLNAVYLVADTGEALVPVATSEDHDAVLDPPRRLSEGIAWDAYRSGDPQVHADVRDDGDPYDPDTAVRSELAIPLGDYGVFLASSTRVDAFSRADVVLAKVLGASVESALDRRRFERELGRFQAFIDESRDLVAVTDAEGDVQFTSRSVERLLGYDPERLVGETGLDLIHPEDRERAREALAELVAEPGSRAELDCRLQTTDGSWRWFAFRGVNRLDDPAVDGVVINGRDVTERRERERALEVLQERTRALMETDGVESTAEVAVETARDVLSAPLVGFHRLRGDPGRGRRLEPIAYVDSVGAADSDTETASGSDAATAGGSDAATTGGSDAATAGGSDSGFDGPPTYRRDTDRPTDRLAWRAMDENRQITISDTRDRPALADATPVRSAVVTPVGDHGVLIVSSPEARAFDETEETLVEILAAALESALDRVARESDLVAQRDDLEVLNQVVRHDIRNDLQLVSAYAELAREHVDEEGEEYVDRVVSSADSAVELTRTARELAEVMQGHDREPEPVALQTTLESEVVQLRRTHADATVTVDHETPVTVAGDEMLSSVFRNLLTNAVQHHDGDDPTVTVSTTVEDGAAVVRVADDGPGIPDDRKETIFGEGERSLESGGTGVGLYLVDRLVDSYGGDVWVEDNDPHGAQFVVQLPLVERPEIRGE